MAPGYRTNAQTRRGNRGAYSEHDDFEGLPVRQWRQEWVNVAPPLQVEAHQQNDRWAAELPHGMPKDWQLLAPHTQELLRAARSGRLYKRPAPADDDDADPDPALDKAEKKEDASDKGYTVKVWKQVPRASEGPTVSHLAKRRKDTVTLKPKADVLQSTGSMITRATIRRVDAAGNPYEQTITLSEGQSVDGEIVSTSVIPAPVATTDAPPQQATPSRRKPPPPRRKPKGPGRGRKKGKLMVPASTRPPPAPSAEAASAALQDGQPSDEMSQSGTQPEGSLQRDDEAMGQSMPPSDDDDDGDDGDDGDEADEGDVDVDMDQGHEDAARTQDTPMQDLEEQHPSPTVGAPHTISQGDSATPPVASTQDLDPTKRSSPGTDATHGPSHMEGSPLKNVALASPAGPSPALSPAAISAVPANSDSLAAPPKAQDVSEDTQSPADAPAVTGAIDNMPGGTSVSAVSDSDAVIKAAETVGPLPQDEDLPMEDALAPQTGLQSPCHGKSPGEDAAGVPMPTTQAKPSSPPSTLPDQGQLSAAASLNEGQELLDQTAAVEASAETLPARQDGDQPVVPAASVTKAVDDGLEAAEQAVEQAAEQAVEQAVEQTVEAATEHAVEAATEHAVEAATEQAVETAAEQAVEAVAEQVVEVAVEATIDAISGPVSVEDADQPSALGTSEVSQPGETAEASLETTSEPAAVPPTLPEPAIEQPPAPATGGEEEDDAPDFLSGLEAELDRQEQLNRAAVSAKTDAPVVSATQDVQPAAEAPGEEPSATDKEAATVDNASGEVSVVGEAAGGASETAAASDAP